VNIVIVLFRVDCREKLSEVKVSGIDDEKFEAKVELK